MEKVSVIMPAYNCEDSINRSIESIINQTYSEWELVIVNDGSTDNTKEVCSRYMEDSRIIYIEIKNQGVSNARNCGIKRASGKYLMFIDSDDTYDKSFIKMMIDNIGNTELICSSYKMIFDYGNESKGPLLNENINYTGDEIYKTIDYLHNKNSLKMLWNKMFLKEIIDNNILKMKENINYGEDYLFVIDYLRYVNSIKILPCTMYNYYIHGNGLSSQNKEDALDRRLYTLSYHEKMYKDKGFPLDYIKRIYIKSFYAEIINYNLKNENLRYYDKIELIKKYLENKKIKDISNDYFYLPIFEKVLKKMIKDKNIKLIYVLTLIETKIKNKTEFYKNRRK